MHERRRRLDYTEPTEKAQADDYGNAVPVRPEVGPVVSCMEPSIAEFWAEHDRKAREKQ